MEPYKDILLDMLSNYIMFIKDNRTHYFRPIIIVVCTYVEILTLYGLWDTWISGNSVDLAFVFTTTCAQHFMSITALFTVYQDFENTQITERFTRTSKDLPIPDEEVRKQMQYQSRVLIVYCSTLTALTFSVLAVAMPQISTSRLSFAWIRVTYEQNSRLSSILDLLNVIFLPIFIYPLFHTMGQLIYYFHFHKSFCEIRLAKMVSKMKNEKDEDLIFDSLKEYIDVVLYQAWHMRISNLELSRYFGMCMPTGFLTFVGCLYSFIITDKLLEKYHILGMGLVVALELAMVTYTGQALSDKIIEGSNDLYNLEWYNWTKKNADVLRLTLLFLNQSNVMELNFYGLMKFGFPLILAFGKLCYTVLTLALNLRSK